MLRVMLLAALLLSLPDAQAKEPQVSTDQTGMKFVRITPGEFLMGTKDETTLHGDHLHSTQHNTGNEKPVLRIGITKPFDLGMHEVTVGQFRKFVTATGYKTDAEQKGGAYRFFPEAENQVERFRQDPECTWRSPGFEQTDTHPVTCVSWRDAQAFCAWKTRTEKVSYRLPTEAEWEYACRAGTETWYCCGNDPDQIYQYGNVADSALYQVHPDTVLRQRVVALKPGEGDGFVYTAPVGSLKPNAWGLYDMHGNLWEWCQDRYDAQRYSVLLKATGKKPWDKPPLIEDPQGPEPTPQHKYGNWRSLRGGCWYVGPISSRCAVRAFGDGDEAFCYYGFRVVREVEE